MIETLDENIEFAVAVLTKLATEQRQKLENGQRLRTEMHAQVENGIAPIGYRAEWLKSSARIIVQTLAEMAEDFNVRYTDDRCSSEDLSDILATAQFIIRGPEDQR